MAVKDIWNKETYEASITATCFSWTPFDGWDARWGEDGPALKDDGQMRRLLELETAAVPLGAGPRKIARQIDELPSCGWCFGQCVEAICRNIGSGDPEAGQPCRCYTVSGERLNLMARYAACLDGWVKQVASLRRNTLREYGRPTMAVLDILSVIRVYCR